MLVYFEHDFFITLGPDHFVTENPIIHTVKERQRCTVVQADMLYATHKALVFTGFLP